MRLPPGLLVGVLEGVVGQRRSVARVLQHVVPCDQPAANHSPPRLEALQVEEEEEEEEGGVYTSSSSSSGQTGNVEHVNVLQDYPWSHPI